MNNFRTTYSGQNGLHLLQPAKTTAFEVGADWNFVSDYTATLTAYYKSEVDHYTHYPNETWVGPRDFWIPYSRTLDNGAYGDTRGVELSMRKSFSHNFSFNVAYNYQWSQITTGKLGNVIRNVLHGLGHNGAPGHNQRVYGPRNHRPELLDLLGSASGRQRGAAPPDRG